MNIKIYTLLYILLVYEREFSIIIIIIIIVIIITILHLYSAISSDVQ